MEETILEKLGKIEQYTLLAAKRVLTIDDVALLTNLSKSHIYKLTCSHQIPYYKPNGKSIYFERAEVEAWMLQCRMATTEEVEAQAAKYIATNKAVSQKGGARI